MNSLIMVLTVHLHMPCAKHSLISAFDVHFLANTIAIYSQLHFFLKRFKIVSVAELVDLLLSGRKLQGRLSCNLSVYF